jgi:hypothetical protein
MWLVYTWHSPLKIITDIQNKMITKKLAITKADKGKSVVMLTIEKYKQKVENFIHDSQYTVISNNPTQHYQKTIKQRLKQYNNFTQKKQVETHKHESWSPKPTCHNKTAQTRYAH